MVWSRRLVPFAVAAMLVATAATAASALGSCHHYLRKPARGAKCRGGDIDCLKRVGANVYDAVTSHRGGEYDVTGTLRRVVGA